MNNHSPIIYYAHSAKDRPYDDWQTLTGHSTNVAEMAAKFAAVFGAEKIAYPTGQLHDVGKCCSEITEKSMDNTIKNKEINL